MWLSFFDFCLSGIKGCKPGGIALVSKEYGKSQPVRALCFTLARYRLNRLSLLCGSFWLSFSSSGSGHAPPHVPPHTGAQRNIPPRFIQDFPCVLVVLPRSSLGSVGRTPAATATSPRSTGFCAIWDCISSSSSSAAAASASALPYFPLPHRTLLPRRAGRGICAYRRGSFTTVRCFRFARCSRRPDLIDQRSLMFYRRGLKMAWTKST